MSRKHHRGRRGQHFKNHFPAQHDNEDSSNSNEDTSQSKSEGNDD